MMIDASGLINGVIASKAGGMLVMYTKRLLLLLLLERSEAASRSVLYPPQGEKEEVDQIIRFG